MGTISPFIALTDKAWFDFLGARAVSGRVDEVNFWSPRSTRPMRHFTPGEPVFFRLKKPHYAIAGYGFFAHFSVLGLREAWEFFGWKNGDPHEVSFLQRIGRYRNLDLLDPRISGDPVGCTVLRDARFWPRSDWIPWGAKRGWAKNIVQGKTEDDPERVQLLLDRVSRDALSSEVQEEWAPTFDLVDMDERKLADSRLVVREGQGTFRTRLLDAYERRCAITGERTEPVLDAAHIQPYLGPRSNHVQNGLLLTKEFHTLFDLGFVTVTPEYEVRVSPQLERTWRNGKRYYEYDRQELKIIPSTDVSRPSPGALEWHGRERFRT